MGWDGGKRLIIKPAAGPPKSFDAEPHHLQGRRLLVDVSGVLHKAARRGAKQVVLSGTSSDAEEYVAQYIQAIFQMGAEPVLVFDASLAHATMRQGSPRNGGHHHAAHPAHVGAPGSESGPLSATLGLWRRPKMPASGGSAN